jgi:hypothetical protein
MISWFRRLLARPLPARGEPRAYHDPFFSDPVVVEDDYCRMKPAG